MTAKPKDAAWVLRMGRHGVQVLAVVLVLALVFTMVNVQQFAAQGHPTYGVQWWIAWLLDPMASLTMAAAIVYEGLLADYGKPKVHWLTATKWYAGVATWGMNIWSSAAAGSFAGIWLHSVAPGLVLLLAEAAPRVRRHMANIIDELESTTVPAPVVPGESVMDLPAPTYQRVVGPSSWVASPEPVPAPKPVIKPEPGPEPATEQVPPVIVTAPPAVVPVKAEAPTLAKPVTPVHRHGGQQVEAHEPVVTPPAPEPERAPKEVTPSSGPQPPGTDLDALIARILDETDDPTIGRRRITELLPDPKPTDHAVKTALARVRAAKVPVLNGTGVQPGAGSEGGSGNG